MRVSLVIAMPQANPLHWGSATYLALMLACLLLRFIIPRTTHRAVHLLREALFVCPALLLYFLVRGLVHAEPAVAFAHAEQIVRFEKAVYLFHELWLQQQILRSNWSITLVNWVYIWLHWPFLVTGTAWLAIFHRDSYPTYRNAFLLSGAVGMLVFLTYPVAPPRFLT